MERVCRLPGHRLPEVQPLSDAPPLTPEQARGWARYADTSPLYQHLIEVVASDPDLMDLLNMVVGSPRPNVLLAGVQFLMFRDGGERLGDFYPSLTERPEDAAGVAGPFREFVMAHRDELAKIARTRHTQTNECRRCAALLPAIWSLPVSAFHLIDVGTSAGLNLHLDRYRYLWGDVSWGEPSQVLLSTENRGAPVLPREIEVLTRTGLDLDPVDLANPDDRLWLEALIWPEHSERRRRLQAAIEIAMAHPTPMVAGDALKTLGPAIEALPGSEPVVVMNSFALNQLPPRHREQLATIIEEGRAGRPIYRVSMEWLTPDEDAAVIAVDDGSGMRKIGNAQPHAEWIELYALP
jgi:hypothetical protein